MSQSNRWPQIVQKNIDNFWQEILLKSLPKWITPDLLSIIRLVMVPFIILYLAWGMYAAAITIFILAVLTDTWDGSLARARGTTTNWGLVLDPLADKTLIIMLALYLLLVYPFKILIFSIIVFELLIMLGAAVKAGQTPPGQKAIKKANFWGKSKMVTQVLGLICAILWLAAPLAWLYDLSVVLIWLSLVLQIKSAMSYI
jgi:CDP-diacylglycerol--glycerol-3-phosphate 3-phosphatidyltransferase